MKVKCNKSYSFHIYDSNKCKLDLLHQKAVKIRDFKNDLSTRFGLEDILNSKFDAVKKFNTQIEGLIGPEIQIAVGEVHDLYSNKLDKYKELIRVQIQKEIVITRYLINGKNFKKDDIKTYEVKFKETNFTKAVTYLAKYWNDGLLEFIDRQIKNPETEDKKRKMYENIVFYVQKYGNRIIDLAKSNNQKLLKSVFYRTIQFNSLNYRGLNRIKDPIIDWNKNKDSALCNCFITLFLDERIEFPTKYSHRFHGDLKDYQKGFNTSYVVMFDGEKPTKIQLSVEREDEVITGKTNYLGVDVNVKNNLFYTSEDCQIDFDRKEFDKYIKFLQYLDQKKSNKSDNKINKHDSKHFDTWKTRIRNRIKEKCSELVSQAKVQGKDHIVMEDLGQFAKSFSRNDEFNGFKYSRLIKLLNLSDIKNILKSIANKNGIQVTFVQSHYTSKICPICGFCHSDNRKCQEEFVCVECGYRINADHGAALKIRDRLSVDVLRTGLLNYSGGLYSPKIMRKDSILGVLHSYYGSKSNLRVNEELKFS